MLETKLLSIVNLLHSKVFRIVLMVLPMLAFASTVSYAAPNAFATITSVICPIYSAISIGIFILGLALIVLGGALYAAAHIMPGQSKGSIQGYGMGMVVGGVIGVIIAELAPFILAILTGNSESAIKSYC
ncbi:MAG: hypothetical protein M1125_04040 [Candidatus Marsarchaeota archaeon]|nr:hypothetical protein [Candidatus Marsarchaeota archaeon]